MSSIDIGSILLVILVTYICILIILNSSLNAVVNDTNINSEMNELFSRCQENHYSNGGITEMRHCQYSGPSLPLQDLEFRVIEFGIDENSLLI
jgi:hypothetical protein